jgi:hypothetical protein
MARKMSKRSALAEATRRWGKTAAVRDDPKQTSTPAQREEYRLLYNEIRERLKAETDTQKRAALHAEEKKLRMLPHRFRFSVGHVILGGFAFMVEGEGDTWEEAFAAADAKRAKSLGKK